MQGFEIQSETIRAGSYKRILLPIYDENGTKITDLTNYALKYTILNKDNSIVKTIDGTIQDDKFLVVLSTADTKEIAQNKYYYQVTVIYPDLNETRNVGVFNVNGSVSL